MVTATPGRTSRSSLFRTFADSLFRTIADSSLFQTFSASSLFQTSVDSSFRTFATSLLFPRYARGPALATVAALACTAGCGERAEPKAAAAPSVSWTTDVDFADPFILREGNVYYAFATGAGGKNIQTAMSTDLVSWRPLPDALPNLPRWASREPGLTWAPSVLQRRGQYVLYYTARDQASGFQCISRATAVRPEGPYVDPSTTPFVCQVHGSSPFCGSIDPSPFVDGDGQAYLYWKSDENSAACQTPPRLWAERLTEDGLGLDGTPTPLVAMDQAWELPIVEGPSVLLHGGTYYLFYSANWYASARYAVGYATCQSPVGPCRKVTTEVPWMKSRGLVLGPGGQEFFRDPEGKLRIAYHAWTGPKTNYEQGGARSLRIDRLLFVDGQPELP